MPAARAEGLDRERPRAYVKAARRGIGKIGHAIRKIAPHWPAISAGSVGDSLTVEQRTLTPLVKVRILVPQPTFFQSFNAQASSVNGPYWNGRPIPLATAASAGEGKEFGTRTTPEQQPLADTDCAGAMVKL